MREAVPNANHKHLLSLSQMVAALSSGLESVASLAAVWEESASFADAVSALTTKTQ